MRRRWGGLPPGGLTSALSSPRRFFGSNWPARALLFVALNIPLGFLALVVALPCLILWSVASWRGALVRGAGRVQATHVALVDPSVAGRLSRVAPSAGRAARLAGAALATGLFFAPVSLVVLLVGGGCVVGMAVAPLLVRWDSVSIFEWVVRGDGEALLLSVLSLPAAVVFVYVASGLALVQTSFLRALMSPAVEVVETQVGELRTSRDLLLDAFDTERRRIEGMLHDGVQHRLVALTMSLGLAEATAPTEEVRASFSRAHRQADEALAELRRVIRGVLPRALTEHGLRPALEDLVSDVPLDIDLDIAVQERLPRRVEQVSYFMVSEALSNVMKHAQAEHVEIRGTSSGDNWTLTVADDGVGGATVRRSGGLEGLALRASALDGHLSVDDRPEGGTVVTLCCPTFPSKAADAHLAAEETDRQQGATSDPRIGSGRGRPPTGRGDE